MICKPLTGKKILFILLSIVIISIIIGLTVFLSIYFSVKLDNENIVAEKASLQIVDRYGEEIDSTFFNRYVKYEDISTNIINAFVALEDKRFFRHNGVDYYRTAGALINNLKHGYFKEGGSTITQQLAKNTQLSGEKTIVRKIKEMKLAHDIEKKYSKEEILEMYLNAIYYGNGIYGIDSACKTYFNKKPIEITVSEGAILAGIVKNPSKYSPISHSDNATTRMKLVCKLLLDQGYISREDYEESIDYRYTPPETDERNCYISVVLDEACKMLNMTEKELIRSKYTIYSNYDKSIDVELKNVLNGVDFDIKTTNGNNASYSITVCDNELGAIIGTYYCDGCSPLNMRRSPGSTIKPISVYTPALEKGTITEANVYNDELTNFNGYIPSNYKGIYYGEVDILTAVKKSINTVAVKVMQETGIEYCLNKTIAAGIPLDEKDANLSLALGGMTYGTTPYEITRAYMALANGGVKKYLSSILSINDEKGNVIYKNPTSKQRIYSEENAYIMTDMLQKTALDGTAKKLSTRHNVAAKTGTTGGKTNNTDAWCVSYTPAYTVCVWIGGRDNSEGEEISVTGGGLPTTISAYIHDALRDNDEDFSVPKGIISAEIDTYAMEKENKIYLSHQYTPDRYKKYYTFNKYATHIEKSPYFDLNNLVFTAKIKDGIITLSHNLDGEYEYGIDRLDLTNGSKTRVFCSDSDISTNDTVNIYDAEYSPYRVYLYVLEVTFDKKTVTKKMVTVIT